MSQKLCLQWNDFKENAIQAFGSLRGDNDFADVTLACEDGLQAGGGTQGDSCKVKSIFREPAEEK